MSEAPPKPAKPIKPTKKSSALDLIDDKKIVTSEEHYLAKQAFVAELTLFYKDHCPEKISGVEHAASVVYKHDELSLVHDLCKKYKVEPEAAQQISLAECANAVVEAYARYLSDNPSKAPPPSVPAAAPFVNIPPPPPRRASTMPMGAERDAARTQQAANEAALAEVQSTQVRARSPPPIPTTRPFSGNFRDTRDQANASAYFTDANVSHSAPGGTVHVPALPSRSPPRPPPGAPKAKDGAEGDGEEESSFIDGEGEDYRSSVHAFDEGLLAVETPVIREGMLVKLRSKDGEAEKHRFILRADSLVYIKSKSGQLGSRAKNSAQQLLSGLTGWGFGTENLEQELTRSINLEEVLVLPLAKGARGGASVGSATGVDIKRVSITSTNVVADVTDDSKTFRLFTRDKSFFVRAESRADRDAWFRDINTAATELQMTKIGRVVSEAEVCPIRVIASTVSACQVCLINFGMMGRRHHCRACGACICDQCSREKVRIPSLHTHALFKVCNLCARELKAARRYGANRCDDL